MTFRTDNPNLNAMKPKVCFKHEQGPPRAGFVVYRLPSLIHSHSFARLVRVFLFEVPMIATLERFKLTEHCTMGVLVIGEGLFFTVEPPWLNNQPFVSCIPEGEYLCKRYSSKRYPDTWEITSVPGRTHILFHAGNRASDSEGCVILGLGRLEHADMVTYSQQAMKRFREVTKQYSEFTLNVVNKPQIRI